jgi:hypothetical protein
MEESLGKLIDAEQFLRRPIAMLVIQKFVN